MQDGGKDDKSVHLSVDPAPPLQETDTDTLQQLLMDETLPLFQRYRAMFSLRNKVNQSRIENNAFLRLQMLWDLKRTLSRVTRTEFSSCSWTRLCLCFKNPQEQGERQ